MLEKLPPLSELFPFTYVGGGHYRENGIPKGENARTLHGAQVPEFIYEALQAASRPSVSYTGLVTYVEQGADVSKLSSHNVYTMLKGHLHVNGSTHTGQFDISVPHDLSTPNFLNLSPPTLKLTLSWSKPEENVTTT